MFISREKEKGKKKPDEKEKLLEFSFFSVAINILGPLLHALKEVEKFGTSKSLL